MHLRTKLACVISVLGVWLAAAPAAFGATTTWTVLGPPWYGPTIDISIDDAPTYRLNNASSVAVSGAYAYTVETSQNRLTVVDIRNPLAPKVVGSLQDSHMNWPAWVTVQGTLAYVASKGNGNAGLVNSGLAIYDISNPLAPRFVGATPRDSRLYGAYGLTVSGSIAYVAAQGCVGGTSCVTNYPGGNALTLVNVATPTAPRVVGSISKLPETQHLDSVVVVGSLAYGTAFYASRVTSFNISNPANPTIIGSLSDSRLNFANDLQVQGRYAYVVDQSTGGARVTVVDVANPAAMKVVGSVLDTVHLSYGYRLRINGRYAFVAAPRAHSLTVVDLLNPAAPKVVASVSDPVTLGYPVGFDLVGDKAFVAAYCPRVQSASTCDPGTYGGFTVVDVSAFGLTAPDTAITAGPPSITTSKTASFSFSSTRRGSSFTCALDAGPATPCTTPQAYSNLTTGGHTFKVTATSLTGVPDPSPATFSWTIT